MEQCVNELLLVLILEYLYNINIEHCIMKTKSEQSIIEYLYIVRRTMHFINSVYIFIKYQ